MHALVLTVSINFFYREILPTFPSIALANPVFGEHEGIRCSIKFESLQSNGGTRIPFAYSPVKDNTLKQVEKHHIRLENIQKNSLFLYFAFRLHIYVRYCLLN